MGEVSAARTGLQQPAFLVVIHSTVQLVGPAAKLQQSAASLAAAVAAAACHTVLHSPAQPAHDLACP